MTDDTGSDTTADGGDGRGGESPDSAGERTLKQEAGSVDPVAVSEEHPVLLFDGVCNLCNWSVQFIIERDPEAQFRFAPLQSAVAQELLDACDYEGNRMDSVVLVEDGEYYAKSDAVLRVTRYLGLPYSLLRPTGLVPTGLRNLVYDFVANRRYRWFGKRERCMMPTPDIERRFLAGRPGPDPD